MARFKVVTKRHEFESHYHHAYIFTVLIYFSFIHYSNILASVYMNNVRLNSSFRFCFT